VLPSMLEILHVQLQGGGEPKLEPSLQRLLSGLALQISHTTVTHTLNVTQLITHTWERKT
jgi:hypothetical protein